MRVCFVFVCASIITTSLCQSSTSPDDYNRLQFADHDTARFDRARNPAASPFSRSQTVSYLPMRVACWQRNCRFTTTAHNYCQFAMSTLVDVAARPRAYYDIQNMYFEAVFVMGLHIILQDNNGKRSKKHSGCNNRTTRRDEKTRKTRQIGKHQYERKIERRCQTQENREES